MFTGIVQGVAIIDAISDHDGIRTFTIRFPPGFTNDLTVGASVAVDGVCLTATEITSPTVVSFDVISESLNVTTLSTCEVGDAVNVERAAKEGAEIGGHPLSGHVDLSASIESIVSMDGNKMLRMKMPQHFMKYVFSKGFIGINGASLTVSAVNKDEGWFEVWLIPETRRATVLEQKEVGDQVNIEIERSTQVVVDTIRDTVREGLGRLQPALEALLIEKGLRLEDLVQPQRLLELGRRPER